MKKLLIALAGVAALSAPLATQARPGGFHGGFRGGYHGYYGGGFYGYRGFYGAGLGFALGAALADPWYYGYPAYYGYYGYYGPAYPPAPVLYADPAYAYAPAPAVGAAPQAPCGQWSWDQAHSKYDWIPAACGSAAPPPAQTN